MKKLNLFFLYFILCKGNAFAQETEFKKIFIADSTVQIEVPVSFAEAKKIKNAPGEPHVKSDHWIFLDKNNLVRLIYEFTFDTAAIYITDNDIPLWTDKQMSALKKSNRYTYLNDGIYLQDGKNIGYIKYSLKQEEAPDSFEMLFFANLNNRLIQFLFSCPLKLRKKWESIADQIANSIRVQGKN